MTRLRVAEAIQQLLTAVGLWAAAGALLVAGIFGFDVGAAVAVCVVALILT